MGLWHTFVPWPLSSWCIGHHLEIWKATIAVCIYDHDAEPSNACKKVRKKKLFFKPSRCAPDLVLQHCISILHCSDQWTCSSWLPKHRQPAANVEIWSTGFRVHRQSMAFSAVAGHYHPLRWLSEKRGRDLWDTPLALLDYPWPLCTARSYIAFHVTVFLRSFNSTHTVETSLGNYLTLSTNTLPPLATSLFWVGRFTTRSMKTCHARTPSSSAVRSKIIWKVLIGSKTDQQLHQWFHQKKSESIIYPYNFWSILKGSS